MLKHTNLFEELPEKYYDSAFIDRLHAYLLKFLHNRVYRGLAVHKDEIYTGEHAAIIDQKLWDEVHAVIANNRVARAAVARTANRRFCAG